MGGEQWGAGEACRDGAERRHGRALSHHGRTRRPWCACRRFRMSLKNLAGCERRRQWMWIGKRMCIDAYTSQLSYSIR
eukprot:scaffold202234_cov28-Tisochrysis_lutea.AAC.1